MSLDEAYLATFAEGVASAYAEHDTAERLRWAATFVELAAKKQVEGDPRASCILKVGELLARGAADDIAAKLEAMRRSGR